MPTDNDFLIAVLPGDGIGPEITAPCLELLDVVSKKTGGFSLTFNHLQGGAQSYLDNGIALPESSLNIAKQSDAILLAAMGLPDIRYPNGTEISPQVDLRMELGLYAGVRPIKTLANIPSVLKHPKAIDIDFILIRESTEGLFASYGKGEIDGDKEARDTLVITRKVSERLFGFSFELAHKRQQQGYSGGITCIDKANVLNSFAFFRSIFDQTAAKNQGVKADHLYVDAAALRFVQRPWDFNVLVTENMFGDILSDLGAGLIGGMGFAPSADIGDEHAVFQPSHGSAPDITGTNKANPTAMFLSAALMLDWLGDRNSCADCYHASQIIRTAVDTTFKNGLLPIEVGGGRKHRCTESRCY